MIYSGHNGLLDDTPYTVTYTTAALRPHKTRFDFLAVTGLSGIVVGSPVAIRLGKPLVIIRKPDDRSNHSYSDLVGENAARGRYVIIDDFIAGGGTYRRVRERLAEPELDCRYVGAYLYTDKLLSWDGDGKISYKPKREKAEALNEPLSFAEASARESIAVERYGPLSALRLALRTSEPPPTMLTQVA
jgi:orotate phosphoribosyltransferase